MLNIYYFSYSLICTVVLVLTKLSNKVSEAVPAAGTPRNIPLGPLTATGKLSNPTYYLPIFKRFENGSSLVSWNWAAFFFTLFWQAYRGLWIKMLLYLGLISLLGFWINTLHTPLIGVVFWLGVSVFYGLLSNYDYYLLKIHRESLWPSLPYKQYKKQAGSLITILFCLSIGANTWYYRASSLAWSYPYTVRLLEGGKYAVGLNKNPQFHITLPEGWRFSPFHSRNGWLAIHGPSVEGLGLAIYDLGEKVHGEFSNDKVIDLIQRDIFGKGWVRGWIFSPSQWSCSRVEKLGSSNWNFCGYVDSQTQSISYHVVFSVLERQLVVVAYPGPALDDKETFQKSLAVFLSSVHDSSSTKIGS